MIFESEGMIFFWTEQKRQMHKPPPTIEAKEFSFKISPIRDLLHRKPSKRELSIFEFEDELDEDEKPKSPKKASASPKKTAKMNSSQTKKSPMKAASKKSSSKSPKKKSPSKSDKMSSSSKKSSEKSPVKKKAKSSSANKKQKRQS